MSSAHKHRNLAGSARAYLQARVGSKFTGREVAEAIGADARLVRSALEKMNRAGVLRIDADTLPKTYYVPTAEQRAELDRTPEARPFRPYRVPQPMLDLMARIRAERDAIPSHYGAGIPQQWKARQT